MTFRRYRLWPIHLIAVLAVGCQTGTPPTLEPETIPDAIAGRYYEVAFTASGGATVTTPNLPSNGLRLVTGSGHALLFGVPRDAGDITFTVTAIVGGPTMFQTPASTQRTYSITINPANGDSGLVLADAAVGFTANSPLSLDLRDSIRGGTAPYTFALYCLDSGSICTDPGPTDRPPDGVTLSAEGILAGVVGPSTGVYANRNDRRFDFIACVTDASSAHACAVVEARESGPPASPTAT
jgi:hypothetical protein